VNFNASAYAEKLSASLLPIAPAWKVHGLATLRRLLATAA
jgi:hypothetical protein